MGYNETITLINYAKDVEFEYNIKIILLIMFISLSIFLLWFSRCKVNRQTHLGESVFYLLNVFAVMVLIFTPMYSFLLLRSVELGIIMYYIMILYLILLSIGTLFVFWWLAQWGLYKVFGVNFKFINKTKGKNRKSAEYRSYD